MFHEWCGEGKGRSGCTWRHFPVPYVEGEPAGPNFGPRDGLGDDAYQPINDPATLTALYAEHAILGHASVWFDGGAVRSSAIVRGHDLSSRRVRSCIHRFLWSGN